MTAATPTIVATCGGLNPGSWADATYGPLIRHAVTLADVKGRAPRVAHVNTAGGDQRSVEGAELEAARAAGVEASHIRFFPHPNIENLREHVLSRDVIWVSGGSLVNLLAVWRAHGLDLILREAWEAGVVLAGGSAGALCWHEGGTTASFGPQIEAVPDGLGLVPGSLGVHYDSDPRRRIAHEAAVGSGDIPPGYALDEGVGLVYSGTRLVDVVTERDGQHAWRIDELDGRAVETRIEPRLLPGFDAVGPAAPTTSPSHPQPTLEEA
ncbi:Type 1 glutamine amidotransferase-like domain-containing protein [Leifsonia sp. NPDC058230]|uniref:Type 1 glutamine amidotransferase-like domain-containing protein n=1 Tax=Leifsonia sp. NPDC058230 TaxID=3346391 RepID=UPI0036DA0805